MTKREFLDTVFALVPNEANKIMDAFDEYVEGNEPHWIPLTHRTFDEQIANFNRVVSSWDINQEYKVALLGMIASLGYEYEKSITPEPHWIPVTEATPTEDDDYWATFEAETGRFVDWASWYQDRWVVWIEGSPAPLSNVIAWQKCPEPYKGGGNMKSSTYYMGNGHSKYGIWNKSRKEFQFGICEDTPMLAEARLFQKIGEDAKKWKFEVREVTE